MLTASIHEIDSDITDSQHLLSTLPRSHPHRPACVYSLATARFDRYGLSNQRDDLDKAILHVTESILLQPRSWLSPKPKILQIFRNLAIALSIRSNDSKQPEDATYSAKYLRHLRDQPLETFGYLRHGVTSSLVRALAVQVQLEAGNVMQNIKEMAVLCHELLTSDASHGDITPSITCFARAVASKTRLLISDQLSNEVIECLRLAKMHKPVLRDVHFALAICLTTRYRMTFVNDDYEEVASMLDEMIASSSPGDSWDGDVARIEQLVTVMAVHRPSIHETPEYAEEAAYRAHRARAFLGSFPVEHPLNWLANRSLGTTARLRFHYFGSIEGLEASSSNSPLSQPMVSLEDYEDDGSEFDHKKMGLLMGLLSGIRNTDITKVDEAIEKGKTILASSASMHPLASCLFQLFGQVLFGVFKRTKKIEYLNESISTLRQLLERPLPQTQRLETLGWLSLSLVARSVSFPSNHMQDLDEAMEILSQWVNDGHANLPDRFQLACLWASVARHTQHTSISTAYESAVSLMQDTLLFAPTLQLQHATLATSGHTHSMPLDYASYQVDMHQLEEAIMTLERGRALLWSEMRHLRASINQLLEADPDLGHKFAGVSRDLEELTKSIPPSHNLSIDDGAADDLRATYAFEGTRQSHFTNSSLAGLRRLPDISIV